MSSRVLRQNEVMLTPKIIELTPPGRRSRPPDAVAHAPRGSRYVAYRRRHPAPPRSAQSEDGRPSSAYAARDAQRGGL